MSAGGLQLRSTKSKDSCSASSPCEVSDKCVSACAAYGRVCPVAARSAADAACSAICKLRESSHLFSDKDSDLSKLNLDDIEIGGMLGEGGFSLVKSCVLKNKAGVQLEGGKATNDGKSEVDEGLGGAGKGDGDGDGDGDISINQKEFAVKFLKRQVMVNKRHFEHGASDLALEANLLSVLDHPNIVKIHGIAAGDMRTNVATGKECGFFIVVDRLYGTLENKIEAWGEEQEKASTGILSRMSSENKEKRRLALLERLEIALPIAISMEFLHSKNIVFRDLKPDNIGFDAQGNVKLFDFGLAKELKPQQGRPDGRYELTGNTGSRRYMAPEVAKNMPYSNSVDVYSFGIMLWEMCTAEKPFFGFSSGKHMSLVVLGGERPRMDSSYTGHWPMNLQWLAKRCWSSNPADRPSFTVIRETLKDILNSKENIRQSGGEKQEAKTSAGSFFKWGRRRSMPFSLQTSPPEGEDREIKPPDGVIKLNLPKGDSANMKHTEGDFANIKSSKRGFESLKKIRKEKSKFWGFLG